MLIEGADTLWRQLLEDLCTAEDLDVMRAGFAALSAEASYRRGLHDKADAERRRTAGGPTHARLARQADLDAAVDEWRTITGGQAPRPDGAGD